MFSSFYRKSVITALGQVATCLNVRISPFFIFQAAYGRREEFFLFGCVMEAAMIDKRMSDKGIQFELSMGNAGNTLDGQVQSAKADETDASVREDLGKRKKREKRNDQHGEGLVLHRVLGPIFN